MKEHAISSMALFRSLCFRPLGQRAFSQNQQHTDFHWDDHAAHL